MFARYTNKYSHMEPGDISYQYMRLQKHVNSRLGDDDMKIEKIVAIPSELLLELAALYTLFSSKDTETAVADGGEYPHDDYRRFSPPASSGTTRSHRPANSERGDDRHSQRSSSIPQQSNYYELAEHGLDHRQMHNESYMEENMHASPSYDDAIGRRNESLPQTRSRSASMNAQTQARERQINNMGTSNRQSPVAYEAKPSFNDNKGNHHTNSKHDFATMTNDKLVEFYPHVENW